MRRVLLIAALVVLLLIDISILPMALLLISLGGAFASVGLGGPWLPLTIFSVVVGGGLIWLITIAAKALRCPRLAPLQER